ncbi:putative reverse transcriptase domain-containing protein [Tanacetum coccineum]
MPTTRSGMTLEAIEELIAQREAEALATYEANRNIENIVESGDENDNGNGGGNGNENGNNNNRSGNHGENARGAMKAARECTYKEFLNSQPLNFKGTKGAVSLARTVGTDAAYARTWKELIKLMIEVTVLGKRSRRWRMNEEEKIERYIWGLPDNIQGNVTSAGTTRLQDTIRMDNNLIDQKVRAIATRNADSKRKTSSKTGYVGTLPLCDKCKLHHHSPCPIKCGNYKKVGHQARDCWTSTTVTCYGCGEKGHTKRYCPESGNQNGDEESRQNLDIVMDTLLLENCYIPVLTDTIANRSFVYTANRHLSDVTLIFSFT